MAQQESATAAGGRVSITRERLVAANRDDSGAQRELLDEAVRVLLAFTPAPSTKVDKPLVTTNADPYVDLVDDAEPTDTDDDDDAGLQDDDDEAGSDDNDDNNEYGDDDNIDDDDDDHQYFGVIMTCLRTCAPLSFNVFTASL